MNELVGFAYRSRSSVVVGREGEGDEAGHRPFGTWLERVTHA